jgi:ATP-dependent Clp protease ATP-binding subunit ClpC
MSSPALALAERSASELTALRKLASELAHARKERATSVHLLAAIADRPGQAADLLRERRLDRDALLKAGRSFDEDGPDAMLRALAEAREVQKRVRTPLPTDRVRPAGPAQLSPDSRHVLTEPTGLHLLIALLGERRFAACRALATIGVDLARLRASAVQQALGLVAARRIPARMLEVPHTAAPSAAPPRPTGVAVPLLPPVPRPPRPATTTPATPVATAIPPSRMPRPTRPSPARPAQRETTPPPSTPEALRERVEPPPASARSHPTSLDPATFPLLSAIGRDLVEASRAGELAPVIGREVEVERVLDVLAKLRANVPVLIGPPGVGKTAVVHGLAERFARGPLRSRKKLIEIGVPDLMAGTGTRGALAERLARLRAEIARADGDVVLFVDEIHELFAGGAADEASSELRVALARGELPLLGATTGESFKKAVEADPTLARRVVAIEIEEPSAEDAFLQVRGASARLADHHRLAFDEEAIAAAIGWSVRYLPGRALPDKALALLDLAGARRKRVLDETEGPFTQGPATGKAQGTANGKPTDTGRRLRMEDVAPIVAEQASIPEERLLETDAERMLALEKTLGERVVGRAEPLSRIATLLRRNAVGLRGRRPIGTFLLLGPTGVGKTETAKAIAEALFDSPDAMTRLDLSEFSEAHAIAKLIGAPPGYVGHEAGGQLTEALRKRPYQVVLLDEVEKAHRDVLQAFLQVFDEGRMTDGRGRLVDFTNTVIVMTSNLGVAELRHVRDRRGIGFGGQASTSTTALEDAVVGAAKKALAPELFNRIDEVVFYPPLERAQIAEIARKLLDEVAERLEAKGVAMQVDDDGIEALLVAGGYDPELGARPMRRAIGRLVEAPIAERLLRRELPPGSTVIVGAEDGKVAIDAVLPS